MPTARNTAVNTINKCVWPSGPYILGGEDRHTNICMREKRMRGRECRDGGRGLKSPRFNHVEGNMYPRKNVIHISIHWMDAGKLLDTRLWLELGTQVPTWERLVVSWGDSHAVCSVGVTHNEKTPTDVTTQGQGLKEQRLHGRARGPGGCCAYGRGLEPSYEDAGWGTGRKMS